MATRKLKVLPPLASDPNDANMIGRAGILAWLSAESLRVDQSYQRHVNSVRVMNLVANWDNNAFGIILVSRRADGQDFIIDGQHRRDAIVAMNRGTALMPCYVLEGLSLQEEADTYWRLNKTRLQPGSADTYKARLIAGEPVALGLQKAASKYGVTILMSPQPLGPAELYAIAAAEGIYQQGDLDWVLGTIRKGWAHQNAALRQDRLLGVHRFLQVFRKNFDPKFDANATKKYDHLIGRMVTNPPNVVVDKAMEFRMTLHSRPATAFGRGLHAIYNAHLKAGNNIVKLPYWPESGSAAYPTNVNLAEDE